jgi:hypothetical protein
MNFALFCTLCKDNAVFMLEIIEQLCYSVSSQCAGALSCKPAGRMRMDNFVSAEDLSMAAGVLLSLVFSYLPGVSERFVQLSPTHKRLVMLALLGVVTGGVFALSCMESPALPGRVVCDQAGAWGLVRAFVLAAIANQSAYALSPRVGAA